MKAELLERALRGRKAPDDGVNDLQNLLLQISLAVMMVFIVANFLFRHAARAEVREQALELERQKLVAAIERVEAAYGERYALPILLVRLEDGTVACDAASCVEDGRLTDNPRFRDAFRASASAAAVDYGDPLALRSAWLGAVLDEAALAEVDLLAENRTWLGAEVEARMAELRRRVSDVQLSCAARMQDYRALHPAQIDDPVLVRKLDAFEKADDATRPALAADVAASLRRHCLDTLAKEAGARLLDP